MINRDDGIRLDTERLREIADVDHKRLSESCDEFEAN
jgi:hypothetical protein